MQLTEMRRPLNENGDPDHNKRAQLVTFEVACHCNDLGCPECTGRVREGVRSSLAATLPAETMVMMDAILDGQGFADPKAPMTRADFFAALDHMHNMLTETQTADQMRRDAIRDLDDKLRATMEKHEAEMATQRDYIAKLEHEATMHDKLVEHLTAPADVAHDHDHTDGNIELK